jgi:hypothetical protein
MRLGVNSEAESTWKRPAPEWWEQGRSAAPKHKRQLHYFRVAGRGNLMKARPHVAGLTCQETGCTVEVRSPNLLISKRA